MPFFAHDDPVDVSLTFGEQHELSALAIRRLKVRYSRDALRSVSLDIVRSYAGCRVVDEVFLSLGRTPSSSTVGSCRTVCPLMDQTRSIVLRRYLHSAALRRRRRHPPLRRRSATSRSSRRGTATRVSATQTMRHGALTQVRTVAARLCVVLCSSSCSCRVCVCSCNPVDMSAACSLAFVGAPMRVLVAPSHLHAVCDTHRPSSLSPRQHPIHARAQQSTTAARPQSRAWRWRRRRGAGVGRVSRAVPPAVDVVHHVTCIDEPRGTPTAQRRVRAQGVRVGVGGRHFWCVRAMIALPLPVPVGTVVRPLTILCAPLMRSFCMSARVFIVTRVVELVPRAACHVPRCAHPFMCVSATVTLLQRSWAAICRGDGSPAPLAPRQRTAHRAAASRGSRRRRCPRVTLAPRCVCLALWLALMLQL